MFTTRQEQDRAANASAGAELGRSLLNGLMQTGVMWAPAPLMTPIVPLTRSPKNLTPETAPVEVVVPSRPSRLRTLLRRLAV
jgi:hypothetical protein